jgi:hypothetical protein
MSDPIDPHELERLRRSIAMLRPDQPAGMKREEATRILEELQRLQRSDRRHSELVARLRAVLDNDDQDRFVP